jgi:hypothetical protein
LAVDWVEQQLLLVVVLEVVAAVQELVAQHFLVALEHRGKVTLGAQTMAILHIEVAVVAAQMLLERLAVA